MNFHNPTDQELLDDLKRGRADALGLLFDRYGRLVFRIARQILRDYAEGEDLMQEVFLEVYRKAGLYDSSKREDASPLLRRLPHRGAG